MAKEVTASEIGRIGGKNSRKNLTPAKKKALASKAAKARWDKWRAAHTKKKAGSAK
jgi:hypothetical protein